jgi:hypothetical protein
MELVSAGAGGASLEELAGATGAGVVGVGALAGAPSEDVPRPKTRLIAVKMPLIVMFLS